MKSQYGRWVTFILLMTWTLSGGACLGPRAAAAFTPRDGTYHLFSPLSGTKWITSPPRYHNGCAEVVYYDSPAFVNGTCGSAAGGDWSIDIDDVAGAPVYVDLRPGSIYGNPVGWPFRVLAGPVGQWDSSANGKYQRFYIQIQENGAWITHSWILLGHVNNFIYSNGTVIAYSQAPYHRVTKVVAYIAPPGTWGDHVHMEVYNTWHYAGTYNWHGPNPIANDATLGPACVRSGTNVSYCNAQLLGSDIVGYAGGIQGIYVEYNNPYFPDF
jgi:hypothetical protein